MKDEIKEAIDNLNGVVKGIYRMDEAGLEIEDIERVLDYITNLQERLHDTDKISCDRAYRIDKAIEYIEETINKNLEWDTYRENKLLNILQGVDKE